VTDLTAARRRAAELDTADPLADRRALFDLPAGVAYFDGNSLGPLTHASRAAVHEVLDTTWGTHLIRSWKEAGWMTLTTRTGDRIAPLIGAAPGTVVACDTTSVNLYKALSAAVALRPGRTRLVVDAGDFPTDLYVAASVAEQHGLELVAVAANELAAVLTATQVDYRSARILDLYAITAAAHAAGALVVWDLAHSAGAIPVDVAVSDLDFAVGCGYKYLNGGPGAPAFVYAAPRLHGDMRQPLAGWFSHADPFAFAAEYEPAPGIERFLCGTTGVLATASLHAALDAFDGLDMSAVRAKSVSLTSPFIELATDVLGPLGYRVASPLDAAVRGSHVALSHPDGEAVIERLAAIQIMADFRPPDLLRFGFAPLYNTHAEVVALVEALATQTAFHLPLHTEQLRSLRAI
jgi:kynureninase